MLKKGGIGALLDQGAAQKRKVVNFNEGSTLNKEWGDPKGTTNILDGNLSEC